MFEAAGWHCVMVKYGPRLAAQPALRERIDAMPNEEYQRLLRADAGELRERLEVDVCRARRRRAAGDVPRPRRPRPRRARRRLPPGRRRAGPPDRRVRLHDQGLDAADGGPPGQPLRAAERRAVRAARAARSAPTPRTRGRRSTTTRPRRRCARRPAGGSSGRSRSSSPIRPRCPTTSGASTRARSPRSRRSGASSSTSCARRREVADRVVTVSPDVGTSTNLGGWINKAGHLGAGRPDRLVRRRHRHARALARVRPRPPHGARHRRGQPRRAARRARRHLVARRPAAAAGRHDLRPVRLARAGAVVVRDLRGRPVDPRRHAERRHARARGRRAPVGDHALDRDRAAGLRGLGARVRAGPRVDAAARAVASSAARAAARAYFRLSTRPIDQSLHTGTREEVLAGGYRLRAPADPRVAIVVMGALVPEAIAAADVLAEEAGVAAEVICVTSADLLFRSFQARAGLGEGDPATIDRLFGAPRPDRHARRRPPAHARVPGRRGRRADRVPGRAELRPVGRHRRALRAPPDRRGVGGRRRARPARSVTARWQRMVAPVGRACTETRSMTGTRTSARLGGAAGDPRRRGRRRRDRRAGDRARAGAARPPGARARARAAARRAPDLAQQRRHPPGHLLRARAR